MMRRISARTVSGFYQSLLLKGVTPTAYTLGTLPVETFYYFLFGIIVYGTLSILSIDLPGLWLPILLFAVAEPIFIQAYMNVLVIRGRVDRDMAIFLLTSVSVVANIIGMSFIPSITYFEGNSAIIMSYIFAFLPSNNFLFSVILIMIRNNRAIQKDNEKGLIYDGSQQNPFSFDGCLIYIICQTTCIILYSIVLILSVKTTLCTRTRKVLI